LIESHVKSRVLPVPGYHEITDRTQHLCRMAYVVPVPNTFEPSVLDYAITDAGRAWLLSHPSPHDA
jgi:hypothetical protein